MVLKGLILFLRRFLLSGNSLENLFKKIVFLKKKMFYLAEKFFSERKYLFIIEIASSSNLSSV